MMSHRLPKMILELPDQFIYLTTAHDNKRTIPCNHVHLGVNGIVLSELAPITKGGKS